VCVGGGGGGTGLKGLTVAFLETAVDVRIT